LLLVVAAAVRSLLATRFDGFTIDEPYHINSGVVYVTHGDFRLNPEQPPLVKLWAGAFVAPRYHPPPFRPLDRKMDERDFHESALFLKNDPEAVQRRARVAMILFNALSLAALAFAARRAFGERPAPVGDRFEASGNASAMTGGDWIALGALLFLVLDPTVAAHLPVVMMDLPVALWSGVAVLMAIAAFRWWKWGDAALASIALGLAFGAKHNGIVAGVAVALVGAVSVALRQQTARSRRIAMVLGVLLGGVTVLWAQYGFAFYETKPGVETFNEPLASKLAALHTGAFRQILERATAAHLLPRAYLWGLADVLRSGVEGRAYPFAIFGRTFIGHTPWYYFPAEVAAKLPLGLLCLSVAGLALARRVRARKAVAGIAACGGCYLLTLMLSNSGYAGVRHALVVYPALAILAGIALAAAWQSQHAWALAAAGVAIFLACAVALPVVRPWEFHNALAGGTERAYLQFDNEGCDLGQRMPELAQFYRARIAPSGLPAYDIYGLLDRDRERRHMRVRTFSDPIDVPGTRFSGWFLVAAQHFASNTPWEDMTPFRRVPPVARFGNVLVYRGTFDLPWMRAFNEHYRAAMLLTMTKHPDLGQVESLLAHSALLDPTAYPTWISLGNVRAKRGDREEAIRAFSEARKWVDPGDPLRREIETHISRLRSRPLQQVESLTNPWAE
jgi:hypothetical protein